MSIRPRPVPETSRMRRAPRPKEGPGELVSPLIENRSDMVMNEDKAESRAKDDLFTLLRIQFHESLELTASQVVADLQKADKAEGLGAIWPYGRCFHVGG